MNHKFSSAQLVSVGAMCALLALGGVVVVLPRISDISPMRSKASGTPPSFKVVGPIGGESYNAGTQQTIQWEQEKTSYAGVLVDIFLKTRQGATESDYYTVAYGIPSLAGTNKYDWIIPSGFNGSNFVIVVRSRSAYSPPGYQISDSSDEVFGIISDGKPTNPPNISLLSPDGGEITAPGKEFSLLWDQSKATSESLTVKFILYKFETPTSTFGSLVQVIANDVSSQVGGNKYVWQIPSSLESGYYKVGIYTNRTWPPPHISSDLSSQVFEVARR